MKSTKTKWSQNRYNTISCVQLRLEMEEKQLGLVLGLIVAENHLMVVETKLEQVASLQLEEWLDMWWQCWSRSGGAAGGDGGGEAGTTGGGGGGGGDAQGKDA
ncbi:hypothetical protein L6452_01034 [Arctium lappa]|uniref:Uncharacterized protein n=1 Tax=Arctium lappa TaxID=4217 RepID=A0ACB9FFK7_ARCLA|nr:hypothetical protein L6452_01034 [Arctium lappa]